MIEPTEAAYEAARSTYDGIVISRGAFGYRAGHHDAIRAAVEAVWPLAVAEGRRQAAADIRAHSPTGDWAARIAEGTEDA